MHAAVAAFTYLLGIGKQGRGVALRYLSHY